MKRLNIFCLVALQLLAFELSEASLIARGSKRTKKPEVHTTEAPIMCFDGAYKLPTCNFDAVDDDEEIVGKKLSRQLRSLEHLSPFREKGGQGHVIMYRFEGCLPSILPFPFPLCKPEDSIGRTVEIQRLYPFRQSCSSHRKFDEGKSLVLPKIDWAEWHRCMRGPWIRPLAKTKKAAESVKKTSPEEPHEDSDLKKSPKRKKALVPNFPWKKTLPKKFPEQSSPQKLDENAILSKFPSKSATEKHQANDNQGDLVSYKTRSGRFNRIVADLSQDSNGEIINQFPEKMKKPLPSLQHRRELPYDEATPYDPEKLEIPRKRREISHPEDDLEVVRSGIKFLFKRSILDDSEKLGTTKLESKTPDNEAVSAGSENPHSKDISVNQTRPNFPRRDSEIPRNGGTPIDQQKPVMIGEEDYDSRKLSEDVVDLHKEALREKLLQPGVLRPWSKRLQAKKEAIVAVLMRYTALYNAQRQLQTTTIRSGVVPFDTSMLKAAKDGGNFPYRKEVSDDTSRIVGTTETPEKNGGKTSGLHDRTVWNEFTSGPKQFTEENEETRPGKLAVAGKVEDNVIRSGNDEVINGNHGENNLRKRVMRKAAKYDHFGDSSFSGRKSLGITDEFP